MDKQTAYEGNQRDSKLEDSENFEKLDIDDVLLKFGATSKFQLVLVTIATLSLILADYNMMLTFFTGHDPAWKCVSNSTSQFCAAHHNVTISSGDEMFGERCKLDRTEWTYTTSKDYSFVTEFDLVCSKTWIGALNGALYHAGGVISGAFGGLLADKYGRKPVMIVPFAILVFASVSSSFISSPIILFVFNTLRGIGHGFRYPMFVYMAEFAHPKYRTLILNIMNLGGSISALLIAALAYLIPAWRPLERYVALPLIGIIVSVILLPESPRWLLATRKKEKAEKVLTKVAQFNNKIISSEIHLSLKKETVTVDKTYTYIDLFRGKYLRRLTFTILLIWFLTPLFYLAIAFQTQFDGGSHYKTYVYSTLADTPAVFVETFLIEKIGRKKTNLGGLAGYSIFMLCFYFVPDHRSWSYALNMSIAILARLSIDVTFNGIFIWTPELFPTVLRSQGLCLCGIFDRAGMFVVPFIWSMLQSRIHKGIFLLMSGLAVLPFLAGLTLPETGDKPLQEKFEDSIEGLDALEEKSFEKYKENL